MEHGQEWIKRQTALIGERVAYYRQRAKDQRGRTLTAQGLAERCSKLGLKIERPAIAKLENGHRQGITVAEVCVLAKALGVSPAALLYPLGHAGTVEALPGQEVPPWYAYKWFIGDTADPCFLDYAARDSSPFSLWEEHLFYDEYVPRAVARSEQYKLVGPEAHAVAEPEAAHVIAALRRIRATMRTLGMTPPPLSPETARILGKED